MNVGLLIYGLDRPLSGSSRYTIELATALAGRKDAPQITLLCAGPPGPLQGRKFRQAALPGCRLLPGLMTIGNVLIPRLARDLKLDIVHDTAGVAPFLFGAGRAKMVLTLHDVFPWSVPGTSTIAETFIHRNWLPRILPKVQAVITASGQSRTDILRFLPVDPSRVAVLPYGIAACFRPLPAPKVKKRLEERFGLSAPYILYSGTAAPRKNLDRLVRAFAGLAGEHPLHSLVLAGPRTDKDPALKRSIIHSGAAGRILAMGPVSDPDLAVLYNGCDLFAFPSLYEGFGLPPLEAMACGAPVVCSSASSLPEVVGDAARLVDPLDVDALTEAMHSLLADPSLREEMRWKGWDRSRDFSWERNAEATMAVYRKVVYY
jgi:glycosyltransferase involved in cell wall biosynthesis